MGRGKKPRGRKTGAAARRAAPVASSGLAPWRLRYARRILEDDLREIGHAAYDRAKRAIEKKLPLDPHQYGDGLRPPLDGIYKLKSSHVRIAYHIEESRHEVWILMIGDRDVMWDRHENEILGRLTTMAEASGESEKGRQAPRKKPRKKP